MSRMVQLQKIRFIRRDRPLTKGKISYLLLFYLQKHHQPYRTINFQMTKIIQMDRLLQRGRSGTTVFFGDMKKDWAKEFVACDKDDHEEDDHDDGSHEEKKAV